jgi:hypothetical protein
VQLKENVNAVIISGILKTNNHNILKQVLLWLMGYLLGRGGRWVGHSGVQPVERGWYLDWTLTNWGSGRKQHEEGWAILAPEGFLINNSYLAWLKQICKEKQLERRTKFSVSDCEGLLMSCVYI